jgi:hypothetical protein
MRKQADGLSALVESSLGQQPKSGHLFDLLALDRGVLHAGHGVFLQLPPCDRTPESGFQLNAQAMTPTTFKVGGMILPGKGSERES